jgi:hypothetical protein
LNVAEQDNRTAVSLIRHWASGHAFTNALGYLDTRHDRDSLPQLQPLPGADLIRAAA